jgi:hypothetical protein
MSKKELIYFLANCQAYTLLICVILCFLFFKSLSKELKLVSYYLFFMMLMSSIGVRMANFGVNNLVTTHLAVLGEFIFLSLFYKEILKEHIFFKKYFRIYLGVIGVLVILNTLYIEPINTFNTNAKVLVLFIIIMFAALFFFERAKKLMQVDVNEKAVRLINSALLVYYSGSFFVFLMYKFTQNNKQFYSKEMLIFNASLYLLFTIVMLIAILMVVLHRPKPET